MYNRILLPLDGSERDGVVLPHAKALAHGLGASVVLARAVTPLAASVRDAATPYAPQLSVDVAKRRTATELAAAETGLARIRSELEAEGIAASLEVVEGEPARAILDLVDSVDADLICMATRARGALGHLILGSVADTVVRDAGVPVMLVHAG